MAFFDKLKGAAEKAKEAAAKAVATAAEMAEKAKEKSKQEQLAAQQAEADRKAAEEKARRQEKEALKESLLENFTLENWEKFEAISTEEEQDELSAQVDEKNKEKFEAVLVTLAQTNECDLGKGDCCWSGGRFYCTCGSDVECPKKKYVKTSQKGIVYAPEHLPYIKYLAGYTKEPYTNSYSGETTIYYLRDVEKYPISFEDAIKAFFAKFLPECPIGVNPGYGFRDGYTKGEEIEFLFDHGIGADNPVMDILYTLHAKFNNTETGSLATLVRFALYQKADMSQAFFKNLSLYDRSQYDFYYSARVLDAANNPILSAQYFDYPERVNAQELYNADNTIKEAGIGGPEKGFYGDVIYNIVNMWSEPPEASAETCDLNESILNSTTHD